jgi:hypothetical protein
MTQEQIEQQAKAWIRNRHAAKGSIEQEATEWANETYDLLWDDPEALWLLILAIHVRDQSSPVQELLSAGEVEDLLAKHGGRFIERIETEARKDPAFAKLLGGVWKNSMADETWERVQAVWDRRGWDGIPD